MRNFARSRDYDDRLAWTAFIMLEKAKAPYLDKAEIDRRVEKARYYPSYNAIPRKKGFRKRRSRGK